MNRLEPREGHPHAGTGAAKEKLACPLTSKPDGVTTINIRAGFDPVFLK